MIFSPLEIIVFLTLTSFVLLMGVTVRRLMTPAGPVSAELKQLPRSMTLSSSEADGVSVSKRIDRWLHRTVRASGVGLAPSTILLLTICSTSLAAAIAFLTELSLPAQLLITVSVMLVVPLVLSLIKRYQTKKFSDQLPPTLDLVARAVQAGESLESAFSIAASSSKEPMKRQLKYCVKQFDLGSSASAVMDAFVKRVPTMEMRIFAHTVSVHRELGGRLSKGLERLAVVIRDRREYVQKVNSMTSLGRFSIGAISFMGVFILIYLMLFQPGYLNKLVSSELGLRMAAYGVLSEVVGLFWVVLTLKAEN